MLHSAESTNFSDLYYFSFLAKCLRWPDEMSSRAGFGPQALVWRPGCRWKTTDIDMWRW